MGILASAIRAASAALSYDPYFDKVSLLLHAESPDGSGTVVDSSSNARTPNSLVDVQIQAAIKKVGAGAFRSQTFSGARLQYAASTDFDYGKPFTLEFWLNVDEYPASTAYWMANDATRYFTLDSGGRMSSSNTGLDGVGVIPLNTWVHIALCRDSTGNVKTFRDGKKVADANYSLDVGGSRPLGLFNVPGRVDLYSMKGYIDEFRWTAGVARYADDFTPSTTPFPDSGPPVAPPVAGTKVTTGRAFNGREYLRGESKETLTKARTFFIDYTPDTAIASKQQIIVANDYDDYGYPHVIGISTTGNAYGAMGWYERTGTQQGAALAYSNSPQNIAGVRQRFAMRLVGTQPEGFTSYTNGKTDVNGQLAGQPNLTLFTKPNLIGYRQLNSGDSVPLVGTIRAVAFWDRTLTDAEIATLMSSDTYDLASFSGLSNAWLPENIQNGVVPNSVSGGSPMTLNSL